MHGDVVGGVVGGYAGFVAGLVFIRKFNLVCCSFGNFVASLPDIFELFVSLSNEVHVDAHIWLSLFFIS